MEGWGAVGGEGEVGLEVGVVAAGGGDVAQGAGEGVVEAEDGGPRGGEAGGGDVFCDGPVGVEAVEDLHSVVGLLACYLLW